MIRSHSAVLCWNAVWMINRKLVENLAVVD